MWVSIFDIHFCKYWSYNSIKFSSDTTLTSRFLKDRVELRLVDISKMRKCPEGNKGEEGCECERPNLYASLACLIQEATPPKACGFLIIILYGSCWIRSV